VRHDLAHGDRRAERVGDFEIEIGVDVLIEVELALPDELHHRGPGEELRHRARAEERLVRDHRLALLEI